jgi:subtilisin family serine protease
MSGSSYAYMNGSSMATAYVAGLASLARNYLPTASSSEIRDAIIYS